MREIVVDTETTGLDPQNDRLISVAAVEVVNFRRTGQFVHFVVNPGRPSHPKALEVHGMTEEFLATKLRFEHVAVSLLDFLGGDTLVAHNAPFDRGFLDAELRRYGFGPRANHWVCTKSIAQSHYGRGGSGIGPMYCPTNRLDDLVRRFGVVDLRALTGRHGALTDALMLTQVYAALHGAPVVPLSARELKLYGVGDGIGEINQGGTGVPAQPQGEGECRHVGGSRGGAGENLRRDARLHNQVEAGRAEPASPASGASEQDRFERSGVDGGPGITEEDIWASGVET